MKIKVILEGIIFAFQLMSTIPFKQTIPYEKTRVRISVLSFPIVGIVLGLLLYGCIVVFSLTSFSPLFTTMVLVTLSIVYTGGLHLDGWMDCSDALFSYQTKERKLEIMKDSRIGAFAAISLVLLLAWKFVLLYEILALLEKNWYFLVIFIPFLTRMNVGLKLLFGKLAKNDGMAYGMKMFSSKKDCFIYLAMLILVFAIAFNYAPVSILFVLGLFISNFCFYLFSNWFDEKFFGGITGDTLGASMEGGELWLWMTLFLLLSFATV